MLRINYRQKKNAAVADWLGGRTISDLKQKKESNASLLFMALP